MARPISKRDEPKKRKLSSYETASSEVTMTARDYWRLFRKMPWVLGMVGVVALVFRFVFICQWFTTPYGSKPYLDAHMYDIWAHAIMRGHLLHDRAFYQSPLFPYVLALVYRIFGHSYWMVALINTVLGTAVCIKLTRLTGRYFGVGAALMAGMLAALYRPFIFYTAPVLKETLEIFLLTLFMAAFMRAIGRNREKNIDWRHAWASEYLWTGVWLGLAVLTRGNILFLGGAVVLLTWRRWGKAAWRALGFFAAGFLLVILPVTIHNAWVSHDFVPITYAAGFNFYIGNREGATGGAAYPAEVATGSGEEASTTFVAEHDTGHALRPSQVSAYWMDRGIDFIAAHPKDAGLLWLKKLGLFFSNDEIPDNYNLIFLMRHIGTVLAGPLPGFALILALAIFGVLASRREQRRETGVLLSLAATYVLSALPFYVTDRYRLPLVVFMLPLAGTTAPALNVLLRTRQWGRMAILEGVAVTVAVIAVLFPPATVTDETIGWTGLADLEFSRGSDSEGLSDLKNAIDMSSQDVGAYFFMQGVFAEDRRNDHIDAIKLLNQGVDLHPSEAASMEESYGRFLLDRQEPQNAIEAFRAALSNKPDYSEALLGLARAQLMDGQHVAALTTIRQGIAADPSNSDFKQLLSGNLVAGQAN